MSSQPVLLTMNNEPIKDYKQEKPPYTYQCVFGADFQKYCNKEISFEELMERTKEPDKLF